MAYTYKQLKQAAEKIGAAYGLGLSDYAKINGYLAANNPDAIKNILSGDLSAVPGAAAAVGVSLGVHTPQKESGPEKNTAGGRSSVRKTKEKRPAVVSDIIPADDIPGGLETVNAEAVDPAALPPSLFDDIENIIQNYCIKYNIDDMRKASAPVWRGACMAVGFSIKKTTALHDTIKEKKQGGSHLSGDKVAALVSFWAYLCALYDKPPLAADFIAFSGVSSSWFYNCENSRGVTSAGACVYKKLMMLQESGLSSALVDGRKNPTGTIFFLKNWHGWKDSREVVHTDGSTGAAAVSYPDFKLLTDQNGGGGDI